MYACPSGRRRERAGVGSRFGSVARAGSPTDSPPRSRRPRSSRSGARDPRSSRGRRIRPSQRPREMRRVWVPRGPGSSWSRSRATDPARRGMGVRERRVRVGVLLVRPCRRVAELESRKIVLEDRSRRGRTLDRDTHGPRAHQIAPTRAVGLCRGIDQKSTSEAYPGPPEAREPSSSGRRDAPRRLEGHDARNTRRTDQPRPSIDVERG